MKAFRTIHLSAALCVAVLAGFRAAPSGAQSLWTTHWADLQGSGSVRIEDVLSVLPGVSTSSVNGFVHHHVLEARSGLSGIGPTVYVDGREARFALFGVNQWALLPVAVADIDSVRVSGLEIAAPGRMSGAGRVDIWTRRPEAHAIRFDFLARNEINDPGPYRYTDRATPNVDRSGPAAVGSASYSYDNWFIRLYGAVDEHHVTDEETSRRTRRFYASQDAAKLKRKALDLLIERSGRSSFASIQAGRTLFQDFFYLHPFNQEIPIEQNWGYLMATHRWSPSERVTLDMRLHRRRVRVRSRTLNVPFGSPITVRENSAEASVTWSSDAAVYRLSADYMTQPVEGSLAEPVRDSNRRIGLTVGGSFRNQDARHRLTVRYLQRIPDGRTPEAPTVRIDWLITAAKPQRIRPSVSMSYVRGRGPSAFSIEEWMADGKPVPVFDDYLRPSAAHPNRRPWTTIDVRVAADARLTSGLKGSTAVFVSRRKHRLLFPFGEPFPGEKAVADASPAPLTAVSGTFVGTRLDVSFARESDIRADVHYMWLAPAPGSSSRFRSVLSGQAGHRMSGTGTWVLHERLRTHVRLLWLPRTTWRPVSSDGSERTISFSVFRIDVSIEKDFLDSYLQLAIGVLNLGAPPARQHPFGSTEDPALQIRARLRLDSSRS